LVTHICFVKADAAFDQRIMRYTIGKLSTLPDDYVNCAFRRFASARASKNRHEFHGRLNKAPMPISDLLI
jgi:hypothetical protein